MRELVKLLPFTNPDAKKARPVVKGGEEEEEGGGGGRTKDANYSRQSPELATGGGDRTTNGTAYGEDENEDEEEEYNSTTLHMDCEIDRYGIPNATAAYRQFYFISTNYLRIPVEGQLYEAHSPGDAANYAGQLFDQLCKQKNARTSCCSDFKVLKRGHTSTGNPSTDSDGVSEGRDVRKKEEWNQNTDGTPASFEEVECASADVLMDTSNSSSAGSEDTSNANRRMMAADDDGKDGGRRALPRAPSLQRATSTTDKTHPGARLAGQNSGLSAIQVVHGPTTHDIATNVVIGNHQHDWALMNSQTPDEQEEEAQLPRRQYSAPPLQPDNKEESLLRQQAGEGGLLHIAGERDAGRNLKVGLLLREALLDVIPKRETVVGRHETVLSCVFLRGDTLFVWFDEVPNT
eukprot:GHVU01007216.1.p1 GENE.GHVU01007216.1~~GHVU01007216.1.p1  ORF type:complete len:405 (+),score=81.67 GHVU01007216.1:3-1217(+)